VVSVICGFLVLLEREPAPCSSVLVFDGSVCLAVVREVLHRAGSTS